MYGVAVHRRTTALFEKKHFIFMELHGWKVSAVVSHHRLRYTERSSQVIMARIEWATRVLQ
jgi:hypothetical protein